MSRFSSRLIFLVLLVQFLTAAYLFVWPSANIAYFAGVVLHLVAGIVFLIALAFALRSILRDTTLTARAGWILLAIGGVLGAVLIYTGTRRGEWTLLYLHIGACLAGGALLASAWAAKRGFLAIGSGAAALRNFSFLIVATLVASGAWWARTVPWQHAYRIENPAIAPASMDSEGDGPGGHFFPSSAQTSSGDTVPEDYFMDSAVCQRCHADIYQQWQSSMHHFSSFNNQWYRKSIEYMQEVDGVQSSKWCAGCHDAALFFPGNFNTPIKDRIFKPPAQAGMGCMVCHSIRRVKSTMGQADFVLEYPAMHKLVASTNPLVRRAIDFLIEENPEPHRRTFLKPFMRAQAAEFCSSCHKVHLDVPVNNYRWIRGFNDYDNWQASGVSGMGARSFYYPPKSQDCADCHMTMVASHDAGNVDGYVHSHRFLAANTAVPLANQDNTQLSQTETFLADGKLRVDIFAISPEENIQAGQRNADVEPAQPGIQTTFAVGEEAETPAPAAGAGPGEPLPPVTAPLNRVSTAVRAGDTVRVDVVVRTLKMGHFFPGGTVDAFDCWLELKATDDHGRTIFWSGMVEDNGHGRVEPGAHFYRSLLVDAHGNAINKRNAWAARATVYAHLIPPGAADTAHFRLQVPKDVSGHIHLAAKLNYRKFAWWNTQFSFAGVSESTGGGDVSKDYDDRRMAFTGDLAQVSGRIHAIPDVPIVVVAQDSVDVEVLPAGSAAPTPKTAFDKNEWQRWNDYGIGLLLQGNLKAAEAAFTKITEMDASNPDGWVNVGRVRLQEGNLAAAKEALEHAIALSPHLARAHYFYARALRNEGRYDDAIPHLREVIAQYPRDRVVRDDLGRIFFLQRRYSHAITEFEASLAVDPEDLEANYNLMLCYTGINQPQRASDFQKRYLRFKADEASQTLTGPYRRSHPDDNLERQPIHEHVSAVAAAGSTKAAAKKLTIAASVPKESD
jgi:tetratricopeptide (TPR) repeat protein